MRSGFIHREPELRGLSLKRRYVLTRARARRSVPRIASGRAASGRSVPILDEGPLTESSEIEDWADAQTEAMRCRWYKEEGSTTTTFDMVVRDLDRFHLVDDVIDCAPSLGARAAHVKQWLRDKLLH